MRSRAIVRELVKQLMQADADEDDDDPIDADPMRF